MSCLTVTNFSCIDSATVTLAPLTLIIGPQASGKSVISKLIYFFNEQLIGIFDDDYPLQERETLLFSEYVENSIEDFKKSFPPQAWGTTAFSIVFEAGPVQVKIWRSKPRKNSLGKLQCAYSSFVEDVFDAYRQESKDALDRIILDKGTRHTFQRWEISLKIREASKAKLRKAIGNDYVASQFFIPAGRSFFTSMGKAVVAFEHGGFLDPITISFGKYFLAMRESLGQFVFGDHRSDKDRKMITALRERISNTLFSGKITIKRNEEYIEADDGRRIPFSIMSSGQQELLPLWLTLNEFLDGGIEDSLVYVEEPEAHLFPSAQSVITEYIAILLNLVKGQKMIITTHSPYILSKVNNLLKAGTLSAESSRTKALEIEKIIPRQGWLKSGVVHAYAIKDRRVESIMGDDRLIDAEYLDNVSGEISRDFNQLLQIEYAK